MRLIDLTGMRFGQLKVLERTQNRKKKLAWKCLCDCGEVTEVIGGHLKTGHTQSCGCLSVKSKQTVTVVHGMARRKYTIPEYGIWLKMRKRCNDTRATGYLNYGGRGISVCERWQGSFQNFIDDMGLRPTANHSIERVNNDGNYEPGNCIWATREVQNRNQRNRSDNTSGHKGITWHKRTKQWMVSISSKYIGIYKNLDDAIAARKDAEKSYWGDKHGEKNA